MWELPFRQVLLLWVKTMEWERAARADRMEQQLWMLATAGAKKEAIRTMQHDIRALRMPIAPIEIPDAELTPWERLMRQQQREEDGQG